MPSVVLQECVTLFCSGCGVKNNISPFFFPKKLPVVVCVCVAPGRAVPELQSQLTAPLALPQPGTQLSSVQMLHMIKDSDVNCSSVARNGFC